MKPKIKQIMFNPELDLHHRLQELYPKLKVVMDDSLKNHKKHVYDNPYGIDAFEFAFKMGDAFYNAYFAYRDSLGITNDKFSLNAMDSIDFMRFAIEYTGGVIKKSHTINCQCCNRPAFVDIVLDFNKATLTLMYSDDKTKEYCTRRDKDVRGTGLGVSCIELNKQLRFKYDFKCRSGKIVIANDLRETKYAKRRVSKEYDSINYKYGMMRMIKHWADRNFLYMQCGNTSPRIYQNDRNGRVIVGDTERKGYVEKGYVCTDLWAVHVMDYADFKEDDIVGGGNITILDVSKLGEDIEVEYHYDYGWWGGKQTLFTLKPKPKG